MEDLIPLWIKWFLIMGFTGTIISSICFALLEGNKITKRVFQASLIFLISEIIGCIILLISIPMVTVDYVEVNQIIKTGISKSVQPGAITMTSDVPLSQRDDKIVVDSKTKQITLSIWDFGAEDGDVVQIIDNGKPLDKPLDKEITLMHKAKTFIVPVNGKIEIKGIKDGGGGGITYALYVKETGETYFNDAPTNGANTYTIINSN